jgi:hypothetical protein
MMVVGATVGASLVLLSVPLSAPVERLRRVKRMLVVLKKLAES